jgi:hypothetical protein
VAAAEAAKPKPVQAQARPMLVRGPRGEEEARVMFDSLFEAA